MKAEGRVFKYGDNVDTDVIIPARYLNSFDPQELASHAMADIDPDFVNKVQPGDLIVANKNFGCGSSREQAPEIIKALCKWCAGPGFRVKLRLLRRHPGLSASLRVPGQAAGKRLGRIRAAPARPAALQRGAPYTS